MSIKIKTNEYEFISLRSFCHNHIDKILLMHYEFVNTFFCIYGYINIKQKNSVIFYAYFNILWLWVIPGGKPNTKWT